MTARGRAARAGAPPLAPLPRGSRGGRAGSASLQPGRPTCTRRLRVRGAPRPLPWAVCGHQAQIPRPGTAWSGQQQEREAAFAVCSRERGGSGSGTGRGTAPRYRRGAASGLLKVCPCSVRCLFSPTPFWCDVSFVCSMASRLLSILRAVFPFLKRLLVRAEDNMWGLRSVLQEGSRFGTSRKLGGWVQCCNYSAPEVMQKGLVMLLSLLTGVVYGKTISAFVCPWCSSLSCSSGG